jgi:D-alanyl-D-alanine carboxypeptidase
MTKTSSNITPSQRPKKITLVLFFLLAVAILGLLYFTYQKYHSSWVAIENNLKDELEIAKDELSSAKDIIASLNTDLSLAHQTLTETKSLLEREQNRNEEFEDQIRKISGTVQILDKLSKTDKELLQKYSKVYFLNEHYKPERLEEIDDEWKYSENRSHQIHSQVIPFFENMVEAAKDDGVDLWVVSAYRSFDTQGQLKAGYTVTYGTGANAFSADQGFSEHQLGTAIDFTTTGMNGGLTAAFENTEAYKWLTDNAHRYGFTLSYPRGNAYYVFEPWHWRFVGRQLARDLHRADAHFYDWEQRKIDEYLVEIFD